MVVVDNEVVGLVRAHRWADITAQRTKLKASGCTKIFDLDAQERAHLVRMLLRKPVRLVFAFLLAEPSSVSGMWADFQRVRKRIEASGGEVIDVRSGLHSTENPEAFEDVVRGQIRRSLQGKESAENGRKGKSGRKPKDFSRGQYRQARTIWKDVVNFPDYTTAEAALKKIRTKDDEFFSLTRAFRKWKGRPKKQPS